MCARDRSFGGARLRNTVNRTASLTFLASITLATRTAPKNLEREISLKFYCGEPRPPMFNSCPPISQILMTVSCMGSTSVPACTAFSIAFEVVQLAFRICD